MIFLSKKVPKVVMVSHYTLDKTFVKVIDVYIHYNTFEELPLTMHPGSNLASGPDSNKPRFENVIIFLFQTRFLK